MTCFLLDSKALNFLLKTPFSPRAKSKNKAYRGCRWQIFGLLEKNYFSFSPKIEANLPSLFTLITSSDENTFPFMQT